MNHAIDFSGYVTHWMDRAHIMLVVIHKEILQFTLGIYCFGSLGVISWYSMLVRLHLTNMHLSLTSREQGVRALAENHQFNALQK